MALDYKLIEIFTSEEARYKNEPLYKAVLNHVRDSKLAARCLVYKGFSGCYETGEVASQNLLALSLNMPIKIEVILPARALDQMVSHIEPMVDDGIVAVQDLAVHSYKTQKQLFPRQLRVRDVMTPNPEKCTLSTPGDQVVKALLSSIFTGMPVENGQGFPVGIITQGDLIYRGKMPVRLGLLSESGEKNMDEVLTSLSRLTAKELMSQPAIFIDQDNLLTQAVGLMLEKGLKRLPVVDSSKKMIGILSRLDIFRTIMKESPDWETIQAQNVLVDNLQRVSDIMRRDTQSVLPEAPVEEVLRIIDVDDIQRVAVVDPAGKFMGLISDSDLLTAFSDHPRGIGRYFDWKSLFAAGTDPDSEFREWLKKKSAADLMQTDLITVHEDTPIDRAIKIMTEKVLKRMVILDAQGKFQGLISRDSLLRAGFSSTRTGRS